MTAHAQGLGSAPGALRRASVRSSVHCVIARSFSMVPGHGTRRIRVPLPIGSRATNLSNNAADPRNHARFRISDGAVSRSVRYSSRECAGSCTFGASELPRPALTEHLAPSGLTTDRREARAHRRRGSSDDASAGHRGDEREPWNTAPSRGPGWEIRLSFFPFLHAPSASSGPALRLSIFGRRAHARRVRRMHAAVGSSAVFNFSMRPEVAA